MFSYDTWGGSWGTSWGGSWGTGTPQPIPATPNYGGGKIYAPRWHIKLGKKKKYFDTAEEAYNYLVLLEIEVEKPKAKKVKHLGKAVIKYGDVDVSTIRIEGRKGDDIFRMNELTFLSALMRRIEQFIEEQDEETSVLLLMM